MIRRIICTIFGHKPSTRTKTRLYFRNGSMFKRIVHDRIYCKRCYDFYLEIADDAIGVITKKSGSKVFGD